MGNAQFLQVAKAGDHFFDECDNLIIFEIASSIFTVQLIKSFVKIHLKTCDSSLHLDVTILNLIQLTRFIPHDAVTFVVN